MCKTDFNKRKEYKKFIVERQNKAETLDYTAYQSLSRPKKKKKIKHHLLMSTIYTNSKVSSTIVY